MLGIAALETTVSQRRQSHEDYLHSATLAGPGLCLENDHCRREGRLSNPIRASVKPTAGRAGKGRQERVLGLKPCFLLSLSSQTTQFLSRKLAFYNCFHPQPGTDSDSHFLVPRVTQRPQAASNGSNGPNSGPTRRSQARAPLAGLPDLKFWLTHPPANRFFSRRTEKNSQFSSSHHELE